MPVYFLDTTSSESAWLIDKKKKLMIRQGQGAFITLILRLLQLKQPRRDFVCPLLSSRSFGGEFPELGAGLGALDIPVLGPVDDVAVVCCGTMDGIEVPVKVCEVPDAELSSAR